MWSIRKRLNERIRISTWLGVTGWSYLSKLIAEDFQRKQSIINPLDIPLRHTYGLRLVLVYCLYKDKGWSFESRSDLFRWQASLGMRRVYQPSWKSGKRDIFHLALPIRFTLAHPPSRLIYALFIFYGRVCSGVIILLFDSILYLTPFTRLDSYVLGAEVAPSHYPGRLFSFSCG